MWNVYDYRCLMYAMELRLIEKTPTGYRLTEFAKRFARDRGIILWESDNVWEWIDNDECIYNAMIEYTRTVDTPTYKGFIAWMGLEGQKTPDGVQWGRQNPSITKEVNP